MNQKTGDSRSHYIILFSIDTFHQKIPDDVIKKYLDSGIDCFNNIIFSDGDMNIIKSGLNREKGKDFEYSLDKIRYFQNQNSIFTVDEIYICANGNVTSNGMGSYIDMDKNNFGNILSLAW